MASLFRQEDRQPFRPAFLYKSGGSKHKQAEGAKLTLPLLVLGTFKFWLSVLTTAAVTEFEFCTWI